MARFVMGEGQRGSQRWIQRAVAERWQALEAPILAAVPNSRAVEWVSPLPTDGWAEYRDAAFLDRLGLGVHAEALAEFWPAGGPQWDALGLTDNGTVLLVEAKAHVGELCSGGSGAGPVSLARIIARLDETAAFLGARADRAAWDRHFYQLGNRLAHLHWLRMQGVDARLILVNFLNDEAMGGPSTPDEWRAAYQVVAHVMGLRGEHRLSRHILHLFPDVRLGAGAS